MSLSSTESYSETVNDLLLQYYQRGIENGKNRNTIRKQKNSNRL